MPYTPDDLKDTYQVDPADKDYTLVKVTDLNPGEVYKFQFAWVYSDRRAITEDSWSITKEVSASTEAQPNPPKFISSNLSSSSGLLFVTWDGVDNTNAQYKGVDRVEVFISGGSFDSSKPVTSFKVAGKKSIVAPAGTYSVTLKAITVLGTYSDPSDFQSATVDAIGETIEAPTNPNGFTLTRILGGLELAWAGTYANGTFKGFEAIEVFVGTSATATSGTYIAAGVLTGDQVVNKIVIPVDGTYCRYSQPVYIHARAVNKNGDTGTLQANVAHEDLGARSAIADDLSDNIISELKLIDGAITATKISDGAISTPKLAALAITSEKIAANAITAGKIQASSIDVTKLAAGTISVNNLEAGNISSTSYVRAGTSGSARVEIASSQVGNVLAGLHIYDTYGNAILAAPLTGGLSVTGGIKSSSSTSYITVGSVSGDSNSGDGKLTFKVSGITYPGYITYESLFGSTAGSLTLAPPSPYNTTGDVPFIDLYSYSGSGSLALYSPGGINLEGTSISLGNSATSVNVQSTGWYPADSGSTYTTYKLLGVTQGGTVSNTNIGLWFSGAYGSSAPGSSIGQNGDLLFST